MARDDAELLEAWRGGDKSSGNELFRRHFRSVRRFFRNKVPPDDVEDLIQRTFAGCVEGRDRFRGDASFRTFLFAVARRQLFKFLRDRAARDRRVDPDFGVSSIHALGQSPSSMMAKQQEHEILLEALQRVSVEHQTMLELYYWEGMSGAEIADVLDIAPATVRTRLFRGRASLEKAFSELAAGKVTGQESFDIEAALRKVGSDM